MQLQFIKVVFTSISIVIKEVRLRKGSAERCLKTTNWSMTIFFGLKLAQKIKSQELFCHECMWVIRVNWFAPCNNQTSQLHAH
jgi:hypothetical protein